MNMYFNDYHSFTGSASAWNVDETDRSVHLNANLHIHMLRTSSQEIQIFVFQVSLFKLQTKQWRSLLYSD